ncbi:MAG: hypothetical protein DME58_06535, partial [Verrucomicrobia bacterium]
MIWGAHAPSRAGERVLAIANFSFTFGMANAATHNKRLFRRDAESNTRDACATRTRRARMTRPRKKRRLSYEGKLTWLTFLAAAPAIVIALALLWFGDHTSKVQWTLTIVIVGCMAAFILSTREHAVRPLQTLSNLLAAL